MENGNPSIKTRQDGFLSVVVPDVGSGSGKGVLVQLLVLLFHADYTHLDLRNKVLSW